MAVVPGFVCFGNSNVDGIAALSTVPLADFTRWTGATSLPSTTPYEVTAPGVRVFTLKLPYTAGDTRNITNTAAATVTFSGAVLLANQINSWVYIRTNTTGQGQHRQVTAGTGTNVATVTPAWAPALAVDGTVEFLTGSHTLTGASTASVLTKVAATTPDFTIADVGRWVVFLSGAFISSARRITAFTADTITLDTPLFGAPAAGDGIRIYSGGGSTTGITAINGSNRDLTFYYDAAASHSTGFEYPNIKALPGTGPRIYNASKTAGFMNFIPELTWQMRSQSAQKVHVLPFGISGTTIRPQNIGTTLAGSTFAWSRDVTHLDWHPASPTNVLQAMKAAIVAWAAAVAGEGNELDIQGLFAVLAENDAQDDASAAAYGENLLLLRDDLRAFCQTYSKRQAKRIPFLTVNLRETVFLRAPTMNAAMAQMAADDDYTEVIDSTLLTYNVDNVHFNGPGQITLGQLFFQSWQSIITAESAALALRNTLPTLTTLRLAVKRRHERNSSSNSLNDVQVDMFLNDSLREIYNTLGDNAWFMRRAELVTLSGTYPNLITLPRNCKRLIRIENQNYPGRALVWKGISYTDEGRVQITLHDYSAGPYIAHYIQKQTELVVPDDIAILPPEHVELLVMLTCKRLSENSGNASIASYYGAEADRLWKYIKRDALRHDRMRQEQMTVIDSYDSWRNGNADGASLGSW